MTAEVVIVGIGQVPVGEHWELSLRTLAARAIQAARKDAGGLKPQALYVGNLLAPTALHQSNLGALLTGNSGLEGIEAFTVEAADASGAGALRLAYMAVASGYVDVAMAVGVEKSTEVPDAELEATAAEITDYDFEATNGLTPTAQAALLMQRYLHEYQAPPDALAEFPLLAHANAVNNPNAMFRRQFDLKAYQKAMVISAPLNLLDKAPYADGAAAVILTRPDLAAKDLPQPLVRVVASSAAIDALALHDRTDPLDFKAVTHSAAQALHQAGLALEEIDLFELHDSFSIYAALSLEACGFAPRGEGCQLAQSGALRLDGKLPINTMGGLKARGHPLGATGLYQAVEAVMQLRGQGGANQVREARRAMIQSLGGPASTVITHILERV